MEKINFEEITIRLETSTRGGGVEISLDTLGFPGMKMTAYQNYLGGGMLGRVCSDCTISDFREDENLSKISEQLKEYFHNLTNPDEESNPWESMSYLKNQNLSSSAY